jgi:uncharacterized protein (DUF2235 family)
MARKPNGHGNHWSTHPKKPRKRLIVCYDGTWNDADNGGNPTNVTRLARAIPPIGDDGVPQIVYYESGVGTGVLDSVIGGAFGIGLEKNIRNGYLFLAHNYCGSKDHSVGDEDHVPDEIYVFGFSRGAYTARSLCGFIGSCKGLLRPNALHKLERAWKFYRTKPSDRNKFEHYEDIENSVRKEASIKCLGIWDTVGALGIPGGWFQGRNQRRYGFHDTELSRLVENAFHAVAIDEMRGPFVPSLWQRPKRDIYNQVVEQVWFPGVHSNVGGSYPDTDLADLTLRWMMGRINAHTGLWFTKETYDYLLPDCGGNPDRPAMERLAAKWAGMIYDSRSRPFFLDKWLPTLRIVAGQHPASRSRLSRVFPIEPCEPFAQAIHWSAMERFTRWSSEDIPKYEPPNIAWAIGAVQRDRIKVVSMDDEICPGTPWAGTGPVRAAARVRPKTRQTPVPLAPNSVRPPSDGHPPES